MFAALSVMMSEFVGWYAIRLASLEISGRSVLLIASAFT